MKQTYQEEKCHCENEVLMCMGKKVEKGEYFCSFKLLKRKKKDKKGTKNNSRQFIKQDIQMGDRHIKTCSVPVIIMGIKKKTSYNLSFMRPIHV